MGWRRSVGHRLEPQAAVERTGRLRETGVHPHRQQPVPQGHRWLTGYGALRYSLAVRAPLRAVRVVRDPFGGRTAPSTYDFTRWFQLQVRHTSTTCTENSS